MGLFGFDRVEWLAMDVARRHPRVLIANQSKLLHAEIAEENPFSALSCTGQVQVTAACLIQGAVAARSPLGDVKSVRLIRRYCVAAARCKVDQLPVVWKGPDRGRGQSTSRIQIPRLQYSYEVCCLRVLKWGFPAKANLVCFSNEIPLQTAGIISYL